MLCFYKWRLNFSFIETLNVSFSDENIRNENHNHKLFTIFPKNHVKNPLKPKILFVLFFSQNFFNKINLIS